MPEVGDHGEQIIGLDKYWILERSRRDVVGNVITGICIFSSEETALKALKVISDLGLFDTEGYKPICYTWDEIFKEWSSVFYYAQVDSFACNFGYTVQVQLEPKPIPVM